MPVSADIFPVEDLDHDALVADLVMIAETLEFIALGIEATDPLDLRTRGRLMARRSKELDRQRLTRELLKRRRAYDRR